MKTKNKNVDCVEMKNDAQRKLLAQYKSQKSRYESYYESYAAFLDAKALESPWQKTILQKFNRPKQKIAANR